MAEQTPNRGYPYPDGSDAPYAALDMQNLATAIDTDIAGIIPQDRVGSVPTRLGNGIGAAYGLTTTGNAIDQGVLFANRPCIVSIQFAIDFTGPAGGTCQVNVQYSINGGTLTAFPGGTQPTGPLVAGDNPRTIPTGDIRLAAGDSLQLNASISNVTAALSWYAPTFFYTARASVHV